MDEKRKEDLRQLFPQIPDYELEETAANLDAYLDLAWEILEDLQSGLSGGTPKEEKTEKN